MLNVACMQKIKIGHRAKFRDKDKYFLQLLFPVRAILRCISTSGVVRARILIEILTNFAHAYISVMAWMGYARARLKTLSSLLKIKRGNFMAKKLWNTLLLSRNGNRRLVYALFMFFILSGTVMLCKLRQLVSHVLIKFLIQIFHIADLPR